MYQLLGKLISRRTVHVIYADDFGWRDLALLQAVLIQAPFETVWINQFTVMHDIMLLSSSISSVKGSAY